MIFFTADYHIGHDNILGLCERPFPDVLSMRTTIVANVATLVAPGDSLYILGDMAWSQRSWFDLYDDLVGGLRLDLHWLAGNHDCQRVKKSAPLAMKVKYDRHTFYLCHWPWASWMSHTLMLHGHAHGKLPRIPGRFDVGVDCWNYAPVSAATLIEMADTNVIGGETNEVGT